MGLPIPKLADKTFDEIVNEARSLINRYAPNWTDHNVHDPGITFIELFAWIAEMQMYYLDRLTDEHERKFLEMAGFFQREREPARVALTFGHVQAEKTVPAHSPIAAVIGGDQVPLETEEDIVLTPVNLVSLKTVSGPDAVDRTEANERDGITFTAFGDIPEEDSVLQLGFDRALPAKDITVTFFLFEDDLSPAGEHDDEEAQVIQSAETVWEYLEGGSWLPLIVKDDATKALTRSGRVLLEGPSAMDPLDGHFWIRCRLAKGTYEIPPVIDRVLMNTVSAVQIETVPNEDLGKGDGRPWQRRKIVKPPVFGKGQMIEIAEGGGVWKPWEEVEELEDSGPGDRHYLFDGLAGEIAFGNGLNGLVPGPKDLIRISYRTTLGSGGNLPAGQHFVILAPGFNGISVTNREKASGGKDNESIEAAQARARKDLSIPYRAITAADFEALALSTPGLRVARAKAIPNYNPLYPCVFNFPNWVTVVVVPVTRGAAWAPLPGPGFIKTVTRHLDLHRLVTTGVSVVAPHYVKISVSCTVKIKKRRSPPAVSAMVGDALTKFLSPVKREPEGNEWQFGRSVYPSEIYQVVDGVEGVDYATDVSISAEGGYPAEEGIVKIDPTGLVYSGMHQITVRE